MPKESDPVNRAPFARGVVLTGPLLFVWALLPCTPLASQDPLAEPGVVVRDQLHDQRRLIDSQAELISQFGYDNGFSFASPDGVKVGPGKVPYALRINSFMQLRHTLFESEGPNPDQNDIEFERLRLQIRGHVYTPDLRYFMQFDGDSDGGEISDFLDYIFTYDIGHGVWGCDPGQGVWE